MKTRLILAAALCLLAHQALPQASNTAPPLPKRLLTAGMGMAAYRGDLADRYTKWGNLFHLGVQGNRGRWLNPYGELTFGKIVAQTTANTLPPNVATFVQTSLFAVGGGAHINFLKTNSLQVFARQGLALAGITPRNQAAQPLADLSLTRADDETLPAIVLAFPTMLGVNYLFPNGFGANVALGWLNTRTDYLDNTSQLANPDNRDNVMRVQFSLVAPLGFVDEAADAQRKERREQRRKALEQQLQKEREAFEQEKRQRKPAPQKKKQR